MRHLLNTLFITSEDAYAALDGENVLVKKGESVAARFPLHTLQSIISFSYAGASPALMGACAKRGVDLVFCTPRGRFLARSSGESRGNVLLRRKQYRTADSDQDSCLIARGFIFGKIANSRTSLERTLRDHALRVEREQFETASAQLRELMKKALDCTELDSLRGIEGTAAGIYFSCMDSMILWDKENFSFMDAAADRRGTGSTLCSLSYIRCWGMTAWRHWRQRGWTPMWASCTATARGALLWRWILWRNSDRVWRTGSCCP